MPESPIFFEKHRGFLDAVYCWSSLSFLNSFRLCVSGGEAGDECDSAGVIWCRVSFSHFVSILSLLVSLSRHPMQHSTCSLGLWPSGGTGTLGAGAFRGVSGPVSDVGRKRPLVSCWFPVGFLAMILIGDCGDLCVGGYVCMCFGYSVWFAYLLMIFCFCQYFYLYRFLVGFLSYNYQKIFILALNTMIHWWWV